MQNRTSSRSHCVIQLSVDTINGRGVLKIVDLAGSERVGKSMSKGESLKEAIKINQSISALGNCVSALASGRSGKNHVPYVSVPIFLFLFQHPNTLQYDKYKTNKNVYITDTETAS
jgi:hypothetical protein